MLAFTRDRGEEETNNQVPEKRRALERAPFDRRHDVIVLQDRDRHVTLEPVREVYRQSLHH